jgi:hypothetical protein
MQNAETCGFMYIKDDLDESILCVVVYDEERADFIAEAEFGSGNQIIAGIEDAASDTVTNEQLAAIKNNLEAQHNKDPRLIGIICGKEAIYTFYMNKQFSKRPYAGPGESLTGEYYLADLPEEM